MCRIDPVKNPYTDLIKPYIVLNEVLDITYIRLQQNGRLIENLWLPALTWWTVVFAAMHLYLQYMNVDTSEV